MKIFVSAEIIPSLEQRFLQSKHLLCTEKNTNIVYLDETLISQNHKNQYIWHDSKQMEVAQLYLLCKVQSNSGVAYADSINIGFTSGAKLVFLDDHTMMGTLAQGLNGE